MDHLKILKAVPLACDALTRRLERASRSRNGHRHGGGPDTCMTPCPELAHGSDAAINFDTASDTPPFIWTLHYT